MAVPEMAIVDDANIEKYRPDLYEYDSLATYVPTLADIGPSELDFYAEQGYLAVEQAFLPAEIDLALTGLMSLLAGDNPEFRGVMYEQASQGVDVSRLSLERKQDYVRKFMHFVDFQEDLLDLSRHPELMRVVSKIVDGQPDLLQDMALLKPPRIGREKPWHQDHAYFDYELQTRVVGVWIALDEATTDNGCMVILPGSHRLGPVVHFRRRDWQICDTDANQGSAVAVPLKPGGALFFSSLMHHGTPTNSSPERRRAIQFHYYPADTPKVTEEERMAVFGSEGKGVTC